MLSKLLSQNRNTSGAFYALVSALRYCSDSSPSPGIQKKGECDELMEEVLQMEAELKGGKTKEEKEEREGESEKRI